MSDKKTEFENLKKELLFSRENGRAKSSAEVLKKCDEFCAGYMEFLDAAKTEREAVTQTILKAEAKGFLPYEEGKKYGFGDKIYFNNRGKALALAVIGKEPVEKGVRIAAAHIDSPRLDLKPNPLYESDELALLKTHYYGGQAILNTLNSAGHPVSNSPLPTRCFLQKGRNGNNR